MNIVIAGAGEVGTHLAKMLSNENHDIILVDENETKLKSLEANFDILTLVGSGVSINDLKEAKIKSADLFIAVTPYETKNITACILAKDLGARKTVARIDNYEYLLPKNKERFKGYGVDSLIYPEMLAAKEIVEALKMTGVRQYYEFSEGHLVMVGIKIRDNAPIVNKTMEEIFVQDKNYRVLAISRNSRTLIPGGSDKVLDGDIVFFLTYRSYLPSVKEKAGKENFDVRNVMIMGGSRIGMKTAQYLPDGFNVKILERDKDRTFRVVDTVEDALVIHGDGRDLELLKQEGIHKMDAFVALTGNAETNILSCLLAKRMGVRKTVAEVENIDYIQLAENFGIGTLINKKLITASHIYELTLQANVSHVKCLTASDAEVLELIAKPGSKITKKAIKDLKIPKDVTIGGIIRGDEGVIAQGSTEIQPNDKVVLFCLPSAMCKIEKLFT